MIWEGNCWLNMRFNALALTHKTHLLSSTTRRVTHHAEANMPIVRATSRVCKFHTCPIILFPSLSSSPLPSLFSAFSLFTHAPPPRSPTPRTEQPEQQKAALSC